MEQQWTRAAGPQQGGAAAVGWLGMGDGGLAGWLWPLLAHAAYLGLPAPAGDAEQHVWASAGTSLQVTMVRAGGTSSGSAAMRNVHCTARPPDPAVAAADTHAARGCGGRASARNMEQTLRSTGTLFSMAAPLTQHEDDGVASEEHLAAERNGRGDGLGGRVGGTAAGRGGAR